MDLKNLKWLWLGMVVGGILASFLFALPVHAGAIPQQQDSSVSVPGSQSNPYWVTPLNSSGQDWWTAVDVGIPYGLNAPYLAGKQAGEYILLSDTRAVAAPYVAMDEVRITKIDSVYRNVEFMLVSQDYVVFNARMTHPICLDAVTCILGG
jgi:hypothetical protein